MNTYEAVHNENKHRFEITEKDGTAFLDYKKNEEQILLLHTEVPDAMGGKGVASALAAFAFQYAAANKLNVKIYCEFVLAYVKRHPGLNKQVS